MKALRSIEALQWIGLLAGPLAFAVEHVVGLGASFARCSPAGSRWDVDPHLYQLTAMAVAAAIVVAGEAAALAAFRATQAVDQEGDPPGGRIRFLSAAALGLGPIFLALVLLDGLGAAAHPACRQA